MSNRVNDEITVYEKLERKIKSTYPELLGWFLQMKASEKTAATCKNYINKVSAFLSFLNKRKITKELVAEYIASLRYINGHETSDSYRCNIHTALSNYFDYLVDEKKIEVNYLHKITYPKNDDLDKINESRIRFTKEDFCDIINATQDGVGTQKARTFQQRTRERDLCIIKLFMLTGMRENELRQIDIEDIDMSKKTITSIGKRGKRICRYIGQEGIDILTPWIVCREKWKHHDGALFISEKGDRLHVNSIAKLVKKYTSETFEGGVSPHKIRSGVASILYEDTRNMELVREVLCHDNSKTTRRYIVKGNIDQAKGIAHMASII